ncbi:radical SAM protein [Alteripontixanthobacter muriae]|uniref:radical SAM protein n=1 Tax=Alteripontixanthobacter muriae TaxID=2705546 RepID=UPI001E30C4E6|nr:radical SAM protein [Alteripontixanthobacter muriae]
MVGFDRRDAADILMNAGPNQQRGRSKSRNAPAGPSPFREQDVAPLRAEKFRDPHLTADGSTRASVALEKLDTLWFNTGTLCNLACASCYIESSPTNDALIYITAAEVSDYLNQIDASGQDVREIGFTGGEPFMNPAFPEMLEGALSRGYQVLVLSNAMKPMRRHEATLLGLRDRFGARLVMRISLDHHTKAVHEAERGPGSWDVAMAGLRWLSENDFALAVAGRLLPHEPEGEARTGFARLFAEEGISVDAMNPSRLTLFPEMDETADVPEITTACWSILGKSPSDAMCSSSRMVVHRKGEPRARVAACTLLPHAKGFDLGDTLAEAAVPVALNHPHCARFCVLGGASCSA